jgi:sulfite reductase (NADPH) hemoprotein beta-component
MYDYTEFDEAFVRARVAQFRGQVERRLDGELTEEEFRPLRLMNGLYLQLHAYMLRVAIPYGTLNSARCASWPTSPSAGTRATAISPPARTSSSTGRSCATCRRSSTRLADVGMHAIQTSGNCIRNVTADHFAGAAADEIEDPRPTAELLRQWSTDHPEFTVPAAQVQDRDHRIAQRPGGDQGPRHRPAHGPQ